MDKKHKRKLQQDYLAAMQVVRHYGAENDCGLNLLRVMFPAVETAVRRLEAIEAEVNDRSRRGAP